MIDLVQDGTLSNRLAKDLFEEYVEGEISAIELVKKKGMIQISDETEINNLIEKVIEENPKMLEQFNAGKEKLFGFFVGQIMKVSNGKANPQIVNNLLIKRLKK